MDDTNLAAPIESLLTGYQLFKEVMGSLGLTINEAKTKFWAPHIDPEDSVPELERFRVESLIAMGTSVPYAKASANPHSSRHPHADEEDDRTDVPLDIDLVDVAPPSSSSASVHTATDWLLSAKMDCWSYTPSSFCRYGHRVPPSISCGPLRPTPAGLAESMKT